MPQLSNKTLITIAGPTASGKTALAIELAKKWNTVIISADARQFYTEMSIGTAKPSAEELAAAPHYFINNLSVQQPYDVGKYAAEVLELLDTLFQQHDKIILCGGSGLFIKAVTDGLDDLPETLPEIREQVQLVYEQNGLLWLQDTIQLKDPEYFQVVDIHNPKRLLRALEVITQTGNTLSSYHKKVQQPRNFSNIKICLDLDRKVLYERINERVNIMIKNGLADEVKTLIPYRDVNALQTVGYTEMFEYFDGKITLQRAIELIQQHTRNYAKRQLTWFRRDPSFIWCKPELSEIEKHCY
ncbi:MAG: tRNA (adenosine(37)-N6)-dimethylallyltransferase MiaA [Bacteroidetes bacterium]|jgi:tRNA dimethylallyltransferase|nr:tRNA (adenosine(37)-N6)-dimethylallyltransferase MiaA [Bacteroidota bacterium]MBP9881075.1 tRNA (adenosine(37)-N6)-dimethylallyltransferase MiaA [Chitinophagales bacterium]